MSVWKKASKANQKTHHERHQPESRKHLGFLEKKKDYVKRARDYNEKQESLKILRKRALNRNPEEFYHHMINSKVKNGIHHEKDTIAEHSRQQIQLMETQDIRYVNMKRVQEMKRIEHLQSGLHLIDTSNKLKNKHTFFFDSMQEAKDYKESTKKKNLEINTSLNKLTEKPLQYFDGLEEVNKKKVNMYNELAMRIKREKELTIVEQKLEIKRHLQTKKKSIPPRKISVATKDAPPIYKWRCQRKR